MNKIKKTDLYQEKNGDVCAYIYCGYLYLQSVEGWVNFTICYC